MKVAADHAIHRYNLPATYFRCLQFWANMMIVKVMMEVTLFYFCGNKIYIKQEKHTHLPPKSIAFKKKKKEEHRAALLIWELQKWFEAMVPLGNNSTTAFFCSCALCFCLQQNLSNVTKPKSKFH